jgi:hypothetical protein
VARDPGPFSFEIRDRESQAALGSALARPLSSSVVGQGARAGKSHARPSGSWAEADNREASRVGRGAAADFRRAGRAVHVGARERHKRSASADRRNLELHILPKWRAREYDELTRADLFELIEGLIGDGKQRGAKVELMDGDLDVFGDGSVQIVSTPGHTPGHCPLLLRLAKTGPILLSGDVAHYRFNMEHHCVPTMNSDPEESRRSMKRWTRSFAMKGRNSGSTTTWCRRRRSRTPGRTSTTKAAAVCRRHGGACCLPSARKEVIIILLCRQFDEVIDIVGFFENGAFLKNHVISIRYLLCDSVVITGSISD